MYEIDYVFDEMSLFHIEELFNISILEDSPTSYYHEKKEGYKSTQAAGIVFQDLQWSLHTKKTNFMLRDMQKKYGENIELYTWYFLKYIVGSHTIEHVHGANNFGHKGFSTITMLSNPDEYMGGELVIHNRDKKEEIVLRKGQTIRIGDDVVHSVNRVNWGERKTLIHWWKVI